ncbi:MAG: Holliday junction branch migration protein RuvA [Candidatus Uhrbacteria bacterium]
MIAKLTGIISYHGIGFVVVDVQDIGYKVNLPDDAIAGLSGTRTFFTHEVQRDDLRELFGFLSMEALELFWQLTSVSGVGPKSGQKIVYSASVREVTERIMKGDVAFFKAVPGVGMKTAQKIILELKGELKDAPTEASSIDPDALEALVGLGYPRKQAEEVLAMIDATSSEDRVKKALKMMGR